MRRFANHIAVFASLILPAAAQAENPCRPGDMLVGETATEYICRTPTKIVIETRIENTDKQPGMKSAQTIRADYKSGIAKTSYETGSTDFGWFKIDAARSKFELQDVRKNPSTFGFFADGQTASGVRFLPNIDYRFRFQFVNGGSKVLLNGCHDGYPSYRIWVDGRLIYEYIHKHANGLSDVAALLSGECDKLVQREIAISAN